MASFLDFVKILDEQGLLDRRGPLRPGDVSDGLTDEVTLRYEWYYDEFVERPCNLIH
jgi:hypothetical protein